MKVDVLAIAAHPDDVELTCGGTMLKMAQRGYKTGILDLTAGEMGTRGTPETRAEEAAAAAKILRVKWRGCLEVPDSDVQPHRPFKILYSMAFATARPTLVVDITAQYEARHRAILAFASQFRRGTGVSRRAHLKSNVFLAIDRLEDEMNQLARHYGDMIGVMYGEPFLVKELMKVDDVVKMEVRSM
jgi:LmbE family N-acetylglucosaminyl deacetylase